MMPQGFITAAEKAAFDAAVAALIPVTAVGGVSGLTNGTTYFPISYILGSSFIPVAAGTAVSRVFYDANDAGFAFSTPVEVAQYADGSYWASSEDSAVVINNDYPAAGDQEGYFANGMMSQPTPFRTGQTTPRVQALDELAVQDGTINWNDYSDNSEFTPGDIISPSFTATPWQLAALGGSGTAMKAIRKNPMTATGGKFLNRAPMEKYIFISASPTAPAAGDIRPPQTGGTASLLNISQADFSRVRAFTLPSGLPNTLATCLAFMQRGQPNFVDEGESRRSLGAGVHGTSDYARDILRNFVQPAALYMMHSSTSEANRNALLAAFGAWATDAVGCYTAGLRTFAAEGQTGVDQFCVALIAALCPTATVFADTCLLMESNLSGQSRFAVTEAIGIGNDINTVSGPGSGSLFNNQPVLPEHVGFPLWSNGSPNPASINYDEFSRGALHSTRYRDVGGHTTFNSVLILGLIETGWEVFIGARATWDTNNDKFATIGIADQSSIISGARFSTSNQIETWAKTLWATHRATMPEGDTALPLTAQPPLQISIDMVACGALTGTSTGADIDYTAIPTSTYRSGAGVEWTGSDAGLTAREARLSHDGVQFGAAVAIDAEDSLTFTGDRWFQERRQNATGWSPWSTNIPYFNGTTAPFRNIVTGGAIPVGAPVNVEAPKLYKHRYPNNSWFFDEITVVGDDDEIIIAGGGLWANGVELTYQWQTRDNGGSATNISGQTGQKWARNVFSTGSITRDLRCQITASDGSGNTTVVNTPWADLPLPSSVLNDMSVDNLTIVEANSTTVHVPADGVYRSTFVGDISFPFVEFQINGLVIGATYRMETQMSAKSTGGRLVNPFYNMTGGTLAQGSNQASAPFTWVSANFVATDSQIRVRVQVRGISDAGDTFDITRIDAVFVP